MHLSTTRFDRRIKAFVCIPVCDSSVRIYKILHAHTVKQTVIVSDENLLNLTQTFPDQVILNRSSACQVKEGYDILAQNSRSLDFQTTSHFRH